MYVLKLNVYRTIGLIMFMATCSIRDYILFLRICYRDQLLTHVLHYQSLVIILLLIQMEMSLKEFIQATTLMTC